MAKEYIDITDPGTVVVHTDGSCYPNPGGPGGWSFLCVYNGSTALKYGCSRSSTNNEMELMAIKHALLYVPAGERFSYPLVIRTDSRYCRDALTEWVLMWRAHGWRTSTGALVKNRKLIEEIFELGEVHGKYRSWDIRYVKGHAGHLENEAVDQHANIARRDQITNWDNEKDNKHNYVA